MSIQEDVIALFKSLLAQMPPNIASVEVRRAGRNKHVVEVALTPGNPKAASLWAAVENGSDVVYFGFGHFRNTWELPMEGKNRKAGKDELLQEIEELCKAVMAGNCSHKWGFLSVTASIQVEGRPPYKVTDMPVFRTSLPLHGTRFYEPYTP